MTPEYLELGVLIVSVIALTWKISKASDEIKEALGKLSERVKAVEVETKHVRADHDRLVVVEGKAEAAHRRLDYNEKRAGNE